MDSAISDLALDLGVFTLDNELESGRETPVTGSKRNGQTAMDIKRIYWHEPLKPSLSKTNEIPVQIQ